MKRLGFFCPPVQRETSHINGSFIAEKDLVRALVEHSSLDAIDFISADSPKALLSSELADLFEAHKGRVRVIDYDWLGAHLPSEDYHAFLQSGPGLDKAAAVRDALARVCTPVTTLLHSVANVAFWNAFAPMYTYPFQPCDALFCSTHPLMEVVSRYRMQAQARLLEVCSEMKLACPALVHVPLGVCDDGPVTEDERAQARAQRGIEADAFCFLCLGRLDMVAKMDLMPLLSAFRDCKPLPSFKKVKLIIAGAVREASYWEDFLREQIKNMGLEGRVEIILNFEDGDRRSLYAMADAFVSVSDSIQESFGIAPVEAMYAGVPVILSDWDGYKELVQHEQTGLLIPTYWADCNPAVSSLHENGMLNGMLSLAQSVAVDVGALRDALVRVVEDPALCERLGKAARKSALERFSWKHVVEMYEATWDALNEEAKHVPWPPKDQMGARMSIFDNFKHYASNIVGPSDTFKTTVRGQRVGSGGELLSIYPGLQAWIDMKLVGKLITLCLNGATVEYVTQESRLPLEHVLYTLLWMLKHDLIKPFDPA